MKRTYYRLSDNYDLSGFILDAKLLAEYLDGDLAIDRPSDTVYTIELVQMTAEEYANIPEYQF